MPAIAAIVALLVCGAATVQVEQWNSDSSRRAGGSVLREERMKLIARLLRLGALLAKATGSAMVLAAGPVCAAEVHLLSAAAMQSVFKEISGDFERASGHRLVIDYATMGAINARVLRGETADLVIGSSASISSLVKAGRIDPGTQTEICKVGVGVVVPSGNPPPKIAAVEDFKRALLAARVVVYADPAGGGAAGIHVGRVIEQLGLAEQLKPKTKFGAGGDVTEVTLGHGAGALGLTQISEIVEKPGAEFVGPLPAELQNYTGVSAGIPVGAARSEGVAAFLAFLKSPAATRVIKSKGMELE